MTNNWLKRFVGWAIALRNRFRIDLFTAARIKIAFWYALVGLAILGVGGYLAYSYIVSIIRQILQIIQALLESPPDIAQVTGTTLITQTINTDLQKMSIAVGIWIIFTMVISAYILAEVILWPIRRAMEQQKRFIANVSHELRTPLSVMKTSSEIALLDGAKATPADLANALRSNLEEIDRMAKITQFLFTFSNVENRLAKIEMSPVNLSEVVGKVVDSKRALAAGKGVTLRFSSPELPTIVKGNATALEEMVLNLVKNAVAYTPSGGSVSVYLVKKNYLKTGYSAITLSVEDTGVGIPEEDLPNIFEAFYRGRNAVKQGRDTNSGLGLAIVKEIATLHKATISAKSEVGRGTTISIKFPSGRS